MARMMSPSLAAQLAQTVPMQNMQSMPYAADPMQGMPYAAEPMPSMQNMPNMQSLQNMQSMSNMENLQSMSMQAQPMCTPVPTQIETGPDAEDSWTCPKCGNLNYGGRIVCNMRKCGAARPLEAWVCPKCGNENRPNRPFCNMRTCGIVKPGLRAHGAGTPLEAWACPACGNDNHQNRPFCNKRTCGMAKPGLRAQDVVAGASPGQMMGMGMMGVGGQNPPGSWPCAKCGNWNWPTRSTCNGKKGTCGMPRGSMSGGSARASGVAPEGSWVCTACSNVNWPTRTTCNGKNCGRQRFEVDAGPPAAVRR